MKTKKKQVGRVVAAMTAQSAGQLVGFRRDGGEG